MLFGVFGLAACDQATTSVTTTDVIPTESVAAPTNLSISGKVLSWTAVAGVTQYRGLRERRPDGDRQRRILRFHQPDRRQPPLHRRRGRTDRL
ncbi:MAG: hypothetical protein M0C28_19070 [Candidatus Moduliflexus flocculans]|nr:hypothetical protein [Candidatus Moduliflexus flocculans]